MKMAKVYLTHLLNLCLVYSMLMWDVKGIAQFQLITNNAQAEEEYESTTYEDEETCGQVGKKPKDNNPENCCAGLEWDESQNACVEAVKYPRKQCEGASDNSCSPGQSCLESEIEDLYGDDEEHDDAVDDVEIKNEETGIKENGKRCYSDKQCDSGWCASKKEKSAYQKKGIFNKVKKMFRTVTFQRRCKALFVCRCADNYEKPIGDGKCCEGLKKDPEGKCVPESQLEWGMFEYTGEEGQFSENTCSVKVDPKEQYAYIQAMFKLRAFEWLTATSNETDCLGYQKRLKDEIGTPLKTKRNQLAKMLEEAQKEIRKRRNELVNAKFSLNKEQNAGEMEREVWQAENRITGEAMLELMIEEQRVMQHYENNLNGIYTEAFNKLQKIHQDWGMTDPKEKGKRCRGNSIFSRKQKNKRRWMKRYKVKAKAKHGNNAVVKDDAVRFMIESMGGKIQTKKSRYFLMDPLMPGGETFKDYGTSGKHRRKLGNKNSVVGIAMIVVGVAAIAAGPGFLMYGGAILAGGIALQARSIKKSKGEEKHYLPGIFNDFLPNLIEYFKAPEMASDIELGINRTCLETNFEQDSSTHYTEDSDYVDEDQYYAQEEQEEEFYNIDNQDMDEFAGEYTGIEDDEIIFEEGKRGEIVDGEVQTPKACVQSYLSLVDLQKISFAQFWMYSHNDKRTYKTFAGNPRHNMMMTIINDFTVVKNYLTSMSGLPGSLGGYREQSIQCLLNRLKDANWEGTAGLAAGAKNYENTPGQLQWEKSRQSTLDCKNCNLKGQAKAHNIKVPTNTSSTLFGKDNNGSIASSIFSKGLGDWNEVNKNYAIARKALLDRNKALMEQDPQAFSENQKLAKIYSQATGVSDQTLQNMGYQIPAGRSPMGGADGAANSSNSSNATTELEAEKVEEKAEVAPKASNTTNDEGNNKKNIAGLFDDMGLDGSSESGSDNFKSHTGLRRRTEKKIIEHIQEHEKKYAPDPSDNLFEKVSKAYVRSAYPRFMQRKKREPASNEKKDSMKSQLLDKLKSFETN